MKRLITYLLLMVLGLAFVNAQERETRSIGSFDEISVSEAITVELKKGSKEEAIVEVEGADLDDIVTEVSGDRLRVEMRNGGRNYRNANVKVYVTYVELEEIDVSSAADVYSDGVISTEKLDVEVSSAGDVDIEVDVDVLEVRVSSAGDMEVKGRANKQYVKVSSSGDYDGYDLESKIAEVDASSSGDARVFVTEKLDADASSAGSISYRGDPEKVYADSSSGGRVRRS